MLANEPAVLRQRIRFTGLVPDAELRSLVAAADALVFPSLYEGFGLPALEAMAAGGPAPASTAGALPEVCGAAAAGSFDPRSVEQIARALARHASLGAAERQAIVERGTTTLARSPGSARPISRPGVARGAATAGARMSAERILPLHFGKLLPPPYAGVEAHVDLLLRALQPALRGTLVACGDPADAVKRAAEFPHPARARGLGAGRAGHAGRGAPRAGQPGAQPAAPARAEPARRPGRPALRGQRAGASRALSRLRRPASQRRIIDRADRIVVFPPDHYHSSARCQR